MNDQASDREGVDDRRPCGCEQECDCDGPRFVDPSPSAEAWKEWARRKAAGTEHLVPIRYLSIEEVRAMNQTEEDA